MSLALLSACHGPAPYTGPALFIGDSLTKNWHVEWALPDTVNNGLAGEKIAVIEADALTKIQTLRPGFVHIMVGTSEKLIRDNVKVLRGIMSLAFAARKSGAVVVIATIPPVAKGITLNSLVDNSRFNTMLQIAARVCGFRVADYNTALATHEGAPLDGLFSDGVHVNDKGYQIMNRVLYDAMGREKTPPK